MNASNTKLAMKALKGLSSIWFWFGFICSALLGERINPTGYYSIDGGSEVPTV